MAIIKSLWFLALAVSTSADPVVRPRTVPSLDEAAAAQAQQRDDTATRALSNTQIKTSDGKCLFVDKLSGDSAENLTPVQVADCGSTGGQGWDVITDGKHINAAGSMLVVSTLTNACLDFDPRGPAGSQVTLYSCGGSPDGSGTVAASQVFPFNNTRGPLSLRPGNGPGRCLAVKGAVLGVAGCSEGDAAQEFTFDGDGTAVVAVSPTAESSVARSNTAKSSSVTTTAVISTPVQTTTVKSTTKKTTVESSIAVPTTAVSSIAIVSTTTKVTDAPAATNTEPDLPASSTDQIQVSRAGNTLNPTAAAEAHQRDDTAVRAFSSVSIRASNGRCLYVEPTAGDYRQNLIPVSLVDCKKATSINAKWDIVTEGKHNDGRGGTAALVLSSLTQGCISFDFRRHVGDKVILFSCGGRADGTGSTNTGQLFPFTGDKRFDLAPVSEGNETCLTPGDERLESGPCTGDLATLFSVFNP